MDFHLICPKCPPIVQIPRDLLDFKTHVATYHLGLVNLRKIDDDGLNDLIEIEKEAIQQYCREYAENVLAQYILEQERKKKEDDFHEKKPKIEVIELETDEETVLVDVSPVEERATVSHEAVSLPSTSEYDSPASPDVDYVEIDDYEDRETISPPEIPSPASPEPSERGEDPKEIDDDMEELIEIDDFEEVENCETSEPMENPPPKKEPKVPIRFPIKKVSTGKVVKNRDRRAKKEKKEPKYERVESDHHVCQYLSCCSQSSANCFLCLGKHHPVDCGSIIEIAERKLQCSVVGRCRECSKWHTDRRPCDPGVCCLCRRRGHPAMFCTHTDGVHQRAKLRKMITQEKLIPTKRLSEILRRRKERMRQEEGKLISRTIFG